jgi:MOSC domain-containing protein
MAEMGKVASLWRYPVKSMQGEELSEGEVTQYGLLGDRVYALVDAAEGKAVSAKNPVRWPMVLGCKALFAEPPKKGAAPPAVRITLQDGSTTESTARDCHQVISKAFKRPVVLAVADRGWMSGVHAALPATWAGKAEQYWPDMDGLDHRDTVTEFTLPRGTFFDGAILHLITIATLIKLHQVYSKGRFEPQRFRPNILIDTPEEATGFVEQSWIGKTITIGDAARHYGFVRPLRHDDGRPGRSAQRQRHSSDGRSSKRRQCRRLCESAQGRHDQTRRPSEDG